jgi:hypothetical protein
VPDGYIVERHYLPFGDRFDVPSPVAARQNNSGVDVVDDRSAAEFLLGWLLVRYPVYASAARQLSAADPNPQGILSESESFGDKRAP